MSRKVRMFSLAAVASVVGDTVVVDAAELKELLGFIEQEDPNVFWGLQHARRAVRDAARRWLLHAHPDLARLVKRPPGMSAETFVNSCNLSRSYRVSPRPRGF